MQRECKNDNNCRSFLGSNTSIMQHTVDYFCCGLEISGNVA